MCAYPEGIEVLCVDVSIVKESGGESNAEMGEVGGVIAAIERNSGHIPVPLAHNPVNRLPQGCEIGESSRFVPHLRIFSEKMSA